MNASEQVRRLWALFQARRWTEAQALLAPDAVCDWPGTLERFQGAQAFIGVNAAYPEGWTIHLLELQALFDGRVHSLVRVDHGPAQFLANSFFVVAAGQIQSVQEYWTDVQEAPAWRREFPGGMPGRAVLPVDVRPGLSLELEPLGLPTDAAK
ncbi:MAG: nuclear transport factor 2 family protein [Burkholderiaceae bacterium]|nr:nuclear transport factor 2 family protein [Roseateles sp.]MBV8471481.1 nuclear transport factor 2 family protein [Burkholderiaceae bacterium]